MPRPTRRQAKSQLLEPLARGKSSGFRQYEVQSTSGHDRACIACGMTMLVQRAEESDRTEPHRETAPGGADPRAQDSLGQHQGSAFSAGFLAGLVLVCDVV